MVFLISVIASMAGLAIAMRELPVGTSYAVWVGIGATLTVAFAMITGTESASVAKVLLIAGIVACVIGLKVVDHWGRFAGAHRRQVFMNIEFRRPTAGPMALVAVAAVSFSPCSSSAPAGLAEPYGDDDGGSYSSDDGGYYDEPSGGGMEEEPPEAWVTNRPAAEWVTSRPGGMGDEPGGAWVTSLPAGGMVTSLPAAAWPATNLLAAAWSATNHRRRHGRRRTTGGGMGGDEPNGGGMTGRRTTGGGGMGGTNPPAAAWAAANPPTAA